MSSQRGNANRTRSQKYNNQFAFKNNLHDTSHITKAINGIQINNVCEKCKHILEWKIKYKKYKLSKAPSKCTKCDQKNVKHSYHIMCESCSKQLEVCPKCGMKAPLVEPENPSKKEQLKLDQELQALLKRLPERKRRTFLRYMQKKGKEGPQKEEEDGKENEALKSKDIIEELKLLTLKDVDDFDFLDDDCPEEKSDEE